jgi:hypothetical protein
MNVRSIGAALLFVVVVGIVLYATLVLDIGPVVIVFDSGHGVHLGDIVVLVLALPVLFHLGRRLTGETK